MNVLKRNKTERFHYVMTNKKTFEDEYYCDTLKTQYRKIDIELERPINVELSPERYDKESFPFTFDIFSLGSYANIDGCDDILYGIETQEQLNAIDVNKLSFSITVDKKAMICHIGKYAAEDGWDMRLIDYNLKEKGDNMSLVGTIRLTYRCYICEHCGERMYFLLPTYRNDNQVLGIFTFDNEDSIKYSTICKEIRLLRDGKPHVRYYKDLIVHKKDTGKTYAINGIHMSGSPFLAKKKASIRNISYNFSSGYNREYGYDEYQRMILKHMEEKHGDEFKYTYQDVHRIPGINEDNIPGLVIDLMYVKSSLGIKNTLLAKFIHDIRQARPSIIQDLKKLDEKGMMKYLKINNKDLVEVYKAINDQFYSPIKYVAALKYVDNRDYIKSLLEENCFTSSFDPKSMRRDFMYHYSKHNSEKRVVNQLMKSQAWTLIDTCRMFSEIKAERKDYELDWSKDISALHDIVSVDYNRRKVKNKRIVANKEITKMFKGFEHSGIEYSMPKSTVELVEIGTLMNICVGSYGERAAAKKCFIVAGYKDGVPVTCIELNRDGDSFRVDQVKKKHNRLPDIDEALALRELFISNHVNADTYDLHNARKVKHLQDTIRIDNEDNVFIPRIDAPALEAVF